MPLRSSSFVDLRRALLDQELEVGVEVAFGEQHVVGALFGHRRRRRDEIVGAGLQRRHDAGELRRVDRHRALQPLADLVGEIDVEALIAAAELRHRVRREGAVHGGLQRLLRQRRRGAEQACEAETHIASWKSPVRRCPALNGRRKPIAVGRARHKLQGRGGNMPAMLDTNANGVYIIAATPFTDDGAVDTASLDRLMDFYVGCGITGVTVLGIMGEAPKLDPRGIGRADTSGGAARERTAGGGRRRRRRASPRWRALAKDVMDAGAGGVMIAPPSHAQDRRPDRHVLRQRRGGDRRATCRSCCRTIRMRPACSWRRR